MNQPGSPNSGNASLDEWLAWLETLSPTEIELGLDRVAQVLEELRLARPGRVIHIAGTNGKGSSAAMLEALFMKAGVCVGAYTSPHLNLYNERIRINGASASDQEIISAFVRVEEVRQDLPLTYFEFGTLAAAVIFEARGVETAILEVGMGGRLDAVNAIEPDAGIITNISLDHCDWLGEDIETIAGEKAGIMRGGKPFVFGSRTIPDAIMAMAKNLGTDLRCFGKDFDYTIESTAPNSWIWTGRGSRLSSLEMPALAGEFQLQNASTVLALIEAMQLDRLLDPLLINSAFSQLKLAGRCQEVQTDRNWLLDVAHNADAAKALSAYMAESPSEGRTFCIIGMLADKDQAGILSPLREQVDAWVAVTAAGGRAFPAGDLAAGIAILTNKPCLIAGSLTEAIQYAHERSSPGDRILVTGSFYVVGPALNWLDSGAKNPAA